MSININKPFENKVDFLINLKIFFGEKVMNIVKNSKLIFLVVLFSLFLSLFNVISTPSAFACSCIDLSGCGCSRFQSTAGEDLVGPLNLSNDLIFIIILAVIILGFIIYKVTLSRKKVI